MINSSNTHLGQESKQKIGITFLFLFLLSTTLGGTGLNWGLPNDFSWHPDTIAGEESIEGFPFLFDNWGSYAKYPKGHYLLISTLYRPLMSYWESSPEQSADKSNKPKKSLSLKQMSTLIIISRIISLVMGVGTVLAVFMAAYTLFDDYRAGVFAALAMALVQDFVFYSHLGTLDVPATFWFSLSLYNGIRAMYFKRWRNYILFGLFSGLSVCTKDPLGGYLAGLFLAMWGVFIDREKAINKPGLREALFGFFSKKILMTLFLSFLVFSILNDLILSPGSFIERMKWWIGGPGVTDYDFGYVGQLNLLKKTLINLYYAIGWPLFTSIVLSSAYCIYKYRWKSAFGIAPLLVFYLIIIVNVKIQYPRFFIPAWPSLLLLVGKGFADLSRTKIYRQLPQFMLIGFVYFSSFLYCVGLDMELLNDSRYRAEKWMTDNLEKSSLIAGMAKDWYLPRPDKFKNRLFVFRDRPKNEKTLSSLRPYFKYLVLSETEWTSPIAFAPSFSRKLLAGDLGYVEIARFENKFLYPQKTVFGFAGWPIERDLFISPKIVIMERKNSKVFQ